MSQPKKPNMGQSSHKALNNVRSVNYATSPLLAEKTPPWRSRLVVALVGLAFLVLIGRAVYIQIVRTDFYLMQGEKRYAHTIELPASRGRIYDRNGLLLASSVPAPSLWMIPKDFQADTEQRKALLKLLNMKPDELTEKLERDPKFGWLRQQLDEELVAQVLALKIKGVYKVREYKRSYPEGEAAAHVVGTTTIDGKGNGGIEFGFQQELQGRDGSRWVVKDRMGRVVEDIVDQTDAVDGRDITLSLDSKVQFFAYQRLREAVTQHGAKAGSAVVLDVLTGEVLALANYPSFNPAQRQNKDNPNVRNRALTDVFEPGSTMKPFTAALAMEHHGYTPASRIQTAPGRLTMGTHTITDAHPHGELSLAEVIQKSSNVGTVKLAMQMPAREMWETFTQVGFGQKPQIDFPGAVTGRLRPYKSWKPIEQATMSYGYGLSASLFQLARAYTVFARDGEVIPLTMLKHEGPAEPVPGQRVMSAQTAKAVRQMLQMAAGPGGTAPKAQAIGYSVGGKTGTARKQEGRVYTTKYRAWFVGLAPVNNPRIVVAVMVDEPSKGVFYGGDVAAPVFSQVVQQTLRMMNVQPDIDVKALINNKPAPPAEQESF
jgi:cell division protein FtsI (penicillin-binding protein 3)